jgi:hypothetical protein
MIAASEHYGGEAVSFAKQEQPRKNNVDDLESLLIRVAQATNYRTSDLLVAAKRLAIKNRVYQKWNEETEYPLRLSDFGRGD